MERTLQQELHTRLIKLAAEVYQRNLLPDLEHCRTIRDARRVVENYDGKHLSFGDRLKVIADLMRT